jgi:hypothetical protein
MLPHELSADDCHPELVDYGRPCEEQVLRSALTSTLVKHASTQHMTQHCLRSLTYGSRWWRTDVAPAAYWRCLGASLAVAQALIDLRRSL